MTTSLDTPLMEFTVDRQDYLWFFIGLALKTAGVRKPSTVNDSAMRTRI